MKKKSKKNINNQYQKKKVTVIEILAVLIIISITIIFTRTGTINLIDDKNKNTYIQYVNQYVDKAVSMYAQDKYKNNTKYFEKKNNAYIIKFINIPDVNIDKDPYGYDFMKEESNVIFDKDTIIVNVKSCAAEENGVQKCYEIVDIDAKEIQPKNIKASMN